MSVRLKIERVTGHQHLFKEKDHLTLAEDYVLHERDGQEAGIIKEYKIIYDDTNQYAVVSVRLEETHHEYPWHALGIHWLETEEDGRTFDGFIEPLDFSEASIKSHNGTYHGVW